MTERASRCVVGVIPRSLASRDLLSGVICAVILFGQE